MQTLKLKLEREYNEILEYQKQYSILLHTAVKFMLKEEKLKSLYDYESKTKSDLLEKLSKLNHIELMNSWFMQCAISEAYSIVNSFNAKQEIYKSKELLKNELLLKKDKTYKESCLLKKLLKIKKPKLIFGGRKNFEDRCKGLISKEEFQKRRLSPIYSIGTAKPYKGNQKFRIGKDLRSIIFQPNRKSHIKFNIISVAKNYEKILNKLFICQENKELPITYKLSSEYVYISFEEDKLYKNDFNFRKIKDRYMSLDLNPNYIGYSIIDWKSSSDFKIIHAGVYSFKDLNNLYVNEKLPSEDKKLKYKSNKKNYEIIQVAKNLINKCCYYRVENFVVEDLNIKPEDKYKGKNFNKLINNQWLRCRFLNNIKKRCKIFGFNYLEVLPQYSSFIGNIVFRSFNYPDQVLSSIEISRRGYEFNHQYILKDKPQIKNIIKIDIITDNIFKNMFNKSMEEFNIHENFKDIIDVYFYFKRNSTLFYRVSLDKFSSSLRTFSSKQSKVKHFVFNPNMRS